MRGTVALIAGLGIAIVLIWLVAARTIGDLLPASPTASPVASVAAAASGGPSIAPPSHEAASAKVSPAPAPTPERTPAATRASTPRPTVRPAGSAASRVAYLAFLARLDEDRRQVGAQTDALLAAAQSGDTGTARSTAVDMLGFADGERDWLAGHPPAGCYADAHAAAGTMVEAYATVAERAIDWAGAKRGLPALAALAALIDAGSVARAALDDLATTLRTTACP